MWWVLSASIIKKKKNHWYVIWTMRDFLVKTRGKETSSPGSQLPCTPSFVIFESLTFATKYKPSFPLFLPISLPFYLSSDPPPLNPCSLFQISRTLPWLHSRPLYHLNHSPLKSCPHAGLCTPKSPPSVYILIHS